MSDTTDDMEHYEPEEWNKMNEQNIPEAEVTPEPSNAIATRPQQPVSTAVDRTSATPEQAKVDAIASLTMSAYARASELKLTPEEIAGLQAEFPDEAFRTGAAGKDNLLYIEHAYLRDRLNKVLGLGQWAIIPRKRWGEDFIIPASRDRGETEACRIYVEAMLMIRGCFVAEAVGDMVYYKNNQSQNYGDAVEGAKTAAFRRCAKELGVGLQAWKKDWCNGWFERNGNRRPSQNAPGRFGGYQGSAPATATRPAHSSAPKPAAKTADVVPPATPQIATEEQKARFMALFPGTNGDYALRFFQQKGWIANTPEAKLADLPLKYVPTTKKLADDLVAQVEAFVSQPPAGEPEAWRVFKMPWGRNKDIPLSELEKNYLYGLVMNYEVEYEYNGAPKKPEAIAQDEEFRRMLDAAGRHYDWIKENAD